MGMIASLSTLLVTLLFSPPHRPPSTPFVPFCARRTQTDRPERALSARLRTASAMTPTAFWIFLFTRIHGYRIPVVSFSCFTSRCSYPGLGLTGKTRESIHQETVGDRNRNGVRFRPDPSKTRVFTVENSVKKIPPGTFPTLDGH